MNVFDADSVLDNSLSPIVLKELIESNLIGPNQLIDGLPILVLLMSDKNINGIEVLLHYGADPDFKFYIKNICYIPRDFMFYFDNIIEFEKIHMLFSNCNAIQW